MSTDDFVQKALQYFKGVSKDQYLNCCQSIIAAFADQTPVPKELFIKLGTGFGGGFAGMGETCGVLIGGILLINAKYGVTGREEHESFKDLKRICKKAVREYFTWFYTVTSKLKCSEIIGFCATTEEGMEKYTYLKQKGEVPCYKIIEESVNYLYKIFFIK